MRKSIKSVAAFAIAAAMAVSLFAPAATVEAASKSNVITKATYNSGDTVKYSYNKKGLVTKSVSKYSSKGSDSDYSRTVTTTYKYNKKNKIATKTTKNVEKSTYYETDKTTRLTIKGKKGTVTTTTTTVTKYTYNKKGLATESVATTTVSKSGSETETSKARGFTGTELADGRIIAGYNDRKADGNYVNYDEMTVDNDAYFYAPGTNFSIGEETTTTTTEYAAGADGTYKVTTTTTTTDTGVNEEEVNEYYKQNSSGAYVLLTKEDVKEWIDSSGDKHTSTEPVTIYIDKATGIGYYSPDFTRTTSVNVTADPKSSSSSTVTTVDDTTDKSVTTTKYTYDKKKRVKKAVATTVNTDNTVTTTTTASSSTYSSSSSKNDSVTKSERNSERTYVDTTTYSYNKKGRATKKVVSNDGIENSKVVASSMEVSSNEETTNYNADGTVSSTSKETRSCDTYPTTTTTVVANGVRTVTETKNPHTKTYSENNTYSNGSTDSESGTTAYTYYGNGGSKSVKTYTSNNTYKSSYDGSTHSSDWSGTRTSYVFDKDGKVTGTVSIGKSTYDGTASDSTYAYYNDTVNKESISDDLAAKAKIDAVAAALEASGTVYSEAKTSTVLPQPSKSTTAYKYDKSGNVKSAKESGTKTIIEDVVNETYGNTIYEIDPATNKTKVKQIAVTHKYTNKDAMENTVKKGTKSLTKKLTVKSGTNDRSKSPATSLSRIIYSVKSKKGSSNANKQQWILQNGAYNGDMGL